MPLSKPVKTTLKVLLIIFVFVLSIAMFAPEPDPKPIEKITHTAEEAFYASHDFVKDNLKSPATAEFPDTDKMTSKKINDTTFSIRSYVDSQNSFSALIRSQYFCIITFLPNDRVNCSELKIE